jgi:hypothetical protein
VAKERTTHDGIAAVRAAFDEIATNEEAIMRYTAFQLHAVKPAVALSRASLAEGAAIVDAGAGV